MRDKIRAGMHTVDGTDCTNTNIVQNYFCTKNYVNGSCPQDPETNSEAMNI